MRRTVYPTLSYDDAEAAIVFLVEAFGFSEHEVHRDDSGVIVHAELVLDTGMIMLGQRRPGGTNVPEASVYVAVDDADAQHDRAVQAGATIVRELTDTDYGSRDFAARDPEGNNWYFGTYRP
jgi:uncharacterized glyoxalase superfamily protein PhnB